MNTKTNKNPNLKLVIFGTYIISCIIAIIIIIQQVWLPYMNAKANNYSNIKSEAFNGTISPIAYIPNWAKSQYWDKKLHFNDIPTKDLIPMPKYDINRLQDERNIVERYTYTVPYMGSYTLNYKEYDGSHLGIDIRAVIGTPVRNIANGVVIKAVHGDLTGNKYVTIRHDNVPIDGKNTTIYSNYLHLSEVTVLEGTKIRKGEMIGKVGNTGISTAPHLHFQIDTEDAPFHPYWPFSSSEAKQNGMNIFQAVTAGLGRSKAEKYTINPLTFVQHYSNGNNGGFINETHEENYKVKTLEEIINFTEIPETADTPPDMRLEDLVSFNESVVASQIIYNNSCDTNDKNFAKKIENLNSKKCILSHTNINPNHKVTRAEALIAIMKFYNIEPKNEISSYLDIPLYETEIHNYAVVASEKGIFKNNSLKPYNNLTKGEFIEILHRFGYLSTAPKNYKAFKDNKNSSLYNSINNYGYHIGAKNQNINPNKILTQNDLVEILSKI